MTTGRASPTPARSTPTSSRETLAEARDNATFAIARPNGPDWPTPDGVAAADAGPVRRGLAELSPTRRRSSWRSSSNGWCWAATPGSWASRSAEYADSVEPVGAWRHDRRHPQRHARDRLLARGLQPGRDDDEVTTGFGFSVGRSSGRSRPRRGRAAEAVDRAVRMLGAGPCASRAPHRGVRPVGHRAVPVDRRRVVLRRPGAEGSLVSRRPPRRVDRARPLVTLIDDPTDPMALRRRPVDAEGLATRPHRRSSSAGVVSGFVHDGYSARALGAASTGLGGAARLQVDPRRRHPVAVAVGPGDRSARGVCSARVGDGVFVLEVQGMHSGVNPVSGDFSTGIEGVMHPRRRARGAGQGGHDRLDVAADAGRHRRWSAHDLDGHAHGRRRGDARDRGRHDVGRMMSDRPRDRRSARSLARSRGRATGAASRST